MSITNNELFDISLTRPVPVPPGCEVVITERWYNYYPAYTWYISWLSAPDAITFDIIDQNVDGNYFKVSGDQTAYFTEGREIYNIHNDTRYYKTTNAIIVSSSFDGTDTTIIATAKTIGGDWIIRDYLSNNQSHFSGMVVFTEYLTSIFSSTPTPHHVFPVEGAAYTMVNGAESECMIFDILDPDNIFRHKGVRIKLEQINDEFNNRWSYIRQGNLYAIPNAANQIGYIDISTNYDNSCQIQPPTVPILPLPVQIDLDISLSSDCQNIAIINNTPFGDVGYNILETDTVGNTITILGNHTDKAASNTILYIVGDGDGGNDGGYTIITSYYEPIPNTTTISVENRIAINTQDGKIYFGLPPREAFIIEHSVIFKKTTGNINVPLPIYDNKESIFVVFGQVGLGEYEITTTIRNNPNVFSASYTGTQKTTKIFSGCPTELCDMAIQLLSLKCCAGNLGYKYTEDMKSGIEDANDLLKLIYLIYSIEQFEKNININEPDCFNKGCFTSEQWDGWFKKLNDLCCGCECCNDGDISKPIIKNDCN